MKTLVLLIAFVAVCLRMNAQVLAKADKESSAQPRREAAAADAQQWEFSLALKDYMEHAYAKSEGDVFGQEAACLLALMDERYVRRVQVTGGDVAVSTQIQKPVVYNALKKIEKHYRARAKKGSLSETDRSHFVHALKVAIACLEDDSRQFEEALKACKKNVEEPIRLFQKVKLNNIYE